MKLQFSATQDYQLEAVKSVIDIFEGQPLAKGDFEVSFAMEGASIAYTENGIGNNLVLTESQILRNIQTIQARNNIPISEKLVSSYSEDQKIEYNRLNFTIEMETGTGKTYTFLRTIYELNKVYGFKKFVIVVPSVAIREGTVKNLEITHEHFQNLYECPPINYVMYDSRNLTSLKNLATSNAIQVLVINIDSFTKDSNVINTIRETGVKPIEYIQATNAIAIIDEPQNMETDVRKQAIQNLDPLYTLRYSATHRNFYNLLYSLNPVQAYDLGLEGVLQNTSIKYADEIRYQIPDVYGYIQSKVDLTRNTIFEILKRCDRYHELEINPQMFLDNVVASIKRNLNALLVAGIRYEQINGQRYEMKLFELEEIETYLENLFEVNKTNKTLFNYIQVDSSIESDFARDCEADEKVKFFFKLPKAFKISTPIGSYTPDWAVILEQDHRIYFVAETKGTLDHQALRELEKMKISCGEKHFALFDPLGVKYKLAVTTRDLY